MRSGGYELPADECGVRSVRGRRRDGSEFSATIHMGSGAAVGVAFPGSWSASSPRLFETADHGCFHALLNARLLEIMSSSAFLADFQDAATRTVDALSTICGARRAVVALWDGDGENLRVVAAGGARAGTERDAADFLTATAGLWGWTLESGTTLLTNDPASDRRGGATGDGPTCFLSVPMPAEDRTVGVLCIADAPNGFGDREREAAEQFALVLAQAARAEQERAESRSALCANHQLRDRIGKAQRLEALGMLFSGVAHDFNNLLTVISGYGDIVRVGLGASHPLAPEVEEILDAVTSAAKLTDRLAMFARGEEQRPRRLDLNALLEETARMLARLVRQEMRIETDFSADPAEVVLDPVAVEQIVLSLAVRARDVLDRKGVLHLSTDNLWIDGSRAGHAPLPYVVLRICVEGAGNPDSLGVSGALPFPGLDDDGEGTCQDVVRRITRECGGWFSVDSAGDETTYRIHFPIADGAQGTTRITVDGSMPAGSERILLVEDEDGVREFVKEALEGAGYRVRSAATGREAIEFARRTTEPIDLFILDGVLPDISGEELRCELSAGRPDARALLISGYPRGGIGWERADPEEPFLAKPFTCQTLVRRVREVLDSRRPGVVEFFEPRRSARSATTWKGAVV